MEQKERRQQTRRWLRRWGDCVRYCAERQREAQEMQRSIEECDGLKSPSMDGMPHGSSTSDPTARTADIRAKMVARYQQRIDEIFGDIDEELKLANQIDYAVSTLDPRQRRVVELMYKRHKRDGFIARLMNYDVSTIWRIENAACDALHKLLCKDASKCE